MGVFDKDLVNGHLFAVCWRSAGLKMSNPKPMRIHPYVKIDKTRCPVYVCLKCRIETSIRFTHHRGFNTDYRIPNLCPLAPCTGWKSYKLKNLLK